jgi:NADH-quinone oxidoreductase subunit L/multicomponent Na+:H+ antiporter subunit D
MSDPITSLRPLAAVLISAFAIIGIYLQKGQPNRREAVTLVTAVGKLLIVASMVPGALAGKVYQIKIASLLPGIEFALRADPLGILFALLASVLWLITSFYSIGYMRGLDEHSQTRYFAAFAASLSAAIGVAFAANLLTLFVFYELLTMATYPLVTHDEDDEARAAGRKYITYTLGGGVAVLAGSLSIFWVTGTTAFTPGGIAALANADPVFARAAFVLLIVGFGVKAALMPLHSWLPDAMVAPTPVSGLLHAVAVVKSGVFGIARVVLDVFGPGYLQELGMGLPLAVVAAFTLLTASVIALRQDNLKRRLAYSTVSQLSYIVLGLGLLTGQALVGGLLHIPAHALMKLTLFFCAGAIHVETHTDDISDMAGIGRRMPLTMTAFGVAAAGMAGIPLVAGFVSKWYLLLGSFELGLPLFAFALLLSGLLNIAYFWPIVYQAFLETSEDHDQKPLIENVLGGRLARADGGSHIGDHTLARQADTNDHAGDHHANADEGSHDGHADEGSHDASDHHETDDGHSEHDHHGGPPAGGWELVGWRGGESTWFMLGPLLATATGSVVLGVIPHTAVFLQIIELVVAVAGGGA